MTLTIEQLEALGNRSRFQHMVRYPIPGVSRILAEATNNPKLTTPNQPRWRAGPWRGLWMYTIYLEELKDCSLYCPLRDKCFTHDMPFAVRWIVCDLFWPALDWCLSEASLLHPDGFTVDVHSAGDFPNVEYAERIVERIYQYPKSRWWGNTAWGRVTDIGKIIDRQNSLTPDRFKVRFSGERGPMSSAVIGHTISAADAADWFPCPATAENPKANCSNCGFCPDSTEPLARKLHEKRPKLH
jgi:hypothetical protein